MKAIVFDLDGTLIDSAPDIHAIANIVLSGAGSSPVTLAQVHSFIGNGAALFVSRMMAATGLPDARHAELHAAFIALYEEAHDLTALYPGVEEALDTLAARGFALGICTNKPLSPARAVLAHFGLLTRFAVVIGGDSLAQSKPHPAPLLKAFDDLGATRGIYVGDSEVDYQTSLVAEVPFALYSEGYRKSPLSDFPDAHPFSDFTALPALIDSMTALHAL